MIPNEKIVLKEKIKNNTLLVTELNIILYDENGNIIWKHNFHYDIIIKAILNKNILKITEFNNKKYGIFIDSGKLIENCKY